MKLLGEKLYSVDEAARRLGVSVTTIRRLVKRSDGLGHFKVGGLIKVSEDHVQEYLRRVQARPSGVRR